MLGMMAYALGSVHSVMSFKKISFVTRLSIIGTLLLISQLYTDYQSKDFTIKNIIFYMGLVLLLTTTVIVYNFMAMRLLKY